MPRGSPHNRSRVLVVLIILLIMGAGISVMYFALVPFSGVASTYPLTINVNPGGTLSGTPSGYYAAGTSITITANPNSGYAFDSWSILYASCDNGINSSPCSFIMPANSVYVIGSFHSSSIITTTATSTTPMTTATTPTTTAPFDFSLSNPASPVIVMQGGSMGLGLLIVLLSGPAQYVNFNANGYPSGVTGQFAPTGCTLVNSCSFQLNIYVQSSAPLGDYQITISVTQSNYPNLAHYASFILRITGTQQTTTTTSQPYTTQSAGFDFIVGNPAPITITQGGSGSVVIPIALAAGIAQPVVVVSSGYPSGVVQTQSANDCTPNPTCILTLAMSVSANSPIGSYSIQVTGRGVSTAHYTSFSLTIASSLIVTTIRTSTTSSTSTTLTQPSFVVLNSSPNCINGPNSAFASQPHPEQCLYLPIPVFGDYHFAHYDLKWTIVFVDSASQLKVNLGQDYTYQKWSSLPNTANTEQQDQQLIQTAIGAWSTAFAAAGKPGFFTFNYVPSPDPNTPVDADVTYYLPRITGPPAFTEFTSVNPYKVAIVMPILSFYSAGDEAKNDNQMFKTAAHELGHSFSLGHECAPDVYGLQYCFISHMPVPWDQNGHTVPSNTQYQFDSIMVQGLDFQIAITTLDTSAIFYLYGIWDSGQSVVPGFGVSLYFLIDPGSYKPLYFVYGNCNSGLPTSPYNTACGK